jgi:hypothetical protein
LLARAFASPWVVVLVCSALGVCAAAIAARAGLKQLTLGPEQDTDFTAWVARPTFVGFGLAALLLVATAPLTAAVHSTRLRTSGLLALGCLAAVCATAGAVQTHTRRDITPRLVSAVETVPATAVDIRPIRVEREGGDHFLGILPMPIARRQWSYPDTSWSGTCAAVARDFTGPQWTEDIDSDGDCDLHASDGLVDLSVGPVETVSGGARYDVELTAMPVGAG